MGPPVGVKLVVSLDKEKRKWEYWNFNQTSCVSIFETKDAFTKGMARCQKSLLELFMCSQDC